MMVRTLEGTPDFESDVLDSLARDDQNRLIAAAVTFVAFGAPSGDPLPAAISTMLGVSTSGAETTPSEARRRIHAMLCHVDEPRVRRVVLRLGAYALGQFGEPGPDDIFDGFVARAARPNIGLAFELLLGTLHSGSSHIGVRDAERDEGVTIRKTGDGSQLSLAPVSGGRTRKRQTWSVFLSILDGSLALRDPDGRPLRRLGGIGSLHGADATGASWRTGPGPAAGMSVDGILAVLKEHTAQAAGAGGHLPAVLAVSPDGWVYGSSLADVPASNEAGKFRLCFEAAATIRPILMCLLDTTDDGPTGESLIAFAARDRSGVIEPKAEVDSEFLARIAPDLGGGGRDEERRAGIAVSVARARGFAEAAKRLFR
ncbi:hypothetical protein [Methylobacterium fujisawaense]